ncbi:biotin--[acetyl-CoA-carboxylase] ligase [Geobacter sp. DSM 9736]|uniref:biotin--[acetyl-CoA-carboxylase] ligase n=1 Tax=Geobacter sp. DSM 9736 TaxID=1277350 RepID=UPI000B514424|nr:biotin--[acetyl-CoA-carboxylase] ligase [Geobacter sp. DSM 9736]SNB45733.1 BirA family transcriptional regulator, biotin operon repressor / biotin-[acetyl-CoA-carboxylase] ligase [Geobacter sp. DSM 9736]
MHCNASLVDSAATGTDHRILDMFRRRGDGILSGEELSDALHISRTAVWKHIKALRDLGYEIAAVPSRGYRLISAPNTLIPPELSAGLDAKRIGSRLVWYREIESTNETAYQLAEEGAAEGTVVLAEAQRLGKGRLGRRWESPDGVNLYCSVILRPPIAPMQAAQLTFSSAVAVARAIEQETDLRPLIKWPNDVLVNGRKVAGLLNELSAETEQVNFIILGIGVNLNMTCDQFPMELRHPATSLLLEQEKAVDRQSFTRVLLRSLDDLYDSFLANGYKPIRDEWLARSTVMGRSVRVTVQEREVTGVVIGIDEYGALLLQVGEGSVEKILAGDVTLI